MADARNALTSRDSHIWTLRMVVLILLGIILALLFVLSEFHRNITVHVPPDLSKGAVLRPGELQKPNAYSFALYVWKGLNEWPVNGKEDYQKAIEKYKCLVTPEFEQWLLKNKEQKGKAGELDRTRFLSEGSAYQESFVVHLGANTYSIATIQRLQERIGGMLIKDVHMNYSLKVIPDSRNCNEMGMALAGFMVDPSRAEQEAEQQSKKSRANQ